MKYITVIGDSSLANQAWINIGGGKKADDAKTDHQENAQAELSVVGHLASLLPGYHICDYARDGYTTADCLHGEKRGAVVADWMDMFPEPEFVPLDDGADSIKKSDYVILSVGGNNLREFLQTAFKINDDAQRKLFLQENFDALLLTLQSEYLAIVSKISALNPAAKIILMLQYYPSVIQNDYRIYTFMRELGAAVNLGSDPLDVIHQVMIKMYQGIFAGLGHNKVLVADLTSSLDPFDNSNHVAQIEPSGSGGRKIAQLLAHIVSVAGQPANQVYRLGPGYHASQVVTVSLEQWRPVHPNEFALMASFGGALSVAGSLTFFQLQPPSSLSAGCDYLNLADRMGNRR